jgi:hypothetical protein
MCGIAGYSLSDRSKVNARQLGHSLLSEIQWRGSMASGYAYFDKEDKVQVYKGAVPGSQLPLKGLPRDARTAIFHTRLTTQGSEKFNENNHPVWSPSSVLALTHNGVIYNDAEVRYDSLKGVEMPEVDTAVIAGVIEYFGLEGVRELSGDAAIAWLDNEKPNELNLARLAYSPVAYTWLLDGSFVYASTQSILEDALDDMKLQYGAVFSLDERVFFNISGGVILDYQQTPEMTEYRWNYYAGYNNMRNLTSGGHGFSNVQTENNTTAFNNVYHEETDSWEFVEDEEDRAEAALNAAMALMKDNTSDSYTPEVDEYYTVDTDGDYKTYPTLDALENNLKWYAGFRAGQDLYNAQGIVRWVEHFVDVGSFGMDGKPISWIEEPGEIYVHEDPNTEGLGYIREGVGLLQRSIGA